jgi:hypothetical protein
MEKLPDLRGKSWQVSCGKQGKYDPSGKEEARIFKEAG